MASIPGAGRWPGGGRGNRSKYSRWEHPRTEEPGGLLSLGWQRVGQDRALGRRQRRRAAPPASPGQRAATPAPVFLPPAISLCVEGTWRNAAAWAGVKRPSRAVGGAQGAELGVGRGAGTKRDGAPPGLLARVRACLEASTAAVQDIARLLWNGREQARG